MVTREEQLAEFIFKYRPIGTSRVLNPEFYFFGLHLTSLIPDVLIANGIAPPVGTDSGSISSPKKHHASLEGEPERTSTPRNVDIKQEIQEDSNKTTNTEEIQGVAVDVETLPSSIVEHDGDEDANAIRMKVLKVRICCFVEVYITQK